jgi:hypothetical protein
MTDRAMNERTKEALSWLDSAPYDSSTALIADRLRIPDNVASITDSNSWWQALTSVQEFWRAASAVLLYWNPERIEQEALRRASDAPKSSKLSEEVQKLMALQQGLVRWRGDSGPEFDNSTIRRWQFYFEAFSECLLALERRAAAIEARAMDFRLRLEFDQTRRVLEDRDAASAIFEAIQAANANPDPGVLDEIVEKKLGAHFVRIDGRLTKVAGDVEFIADHTQTLAMASMLPKEQAKKAVGQIMSSLGRAALAEPVKALIRAAMGGI